MKGPQAPEIFRDPFDLYKVHCSPCFIGKDPTGFAALQPNAGYTNAVRGVKEKGKGNRIGRAGVLAKKEVRQDDAG